MSETITLPIHCPFCQRPISVRLTIPRAMETPKPPVVYEIPCPHCQRAMQPKLHARFESVSAGHDEDSADV